MGRQGSGREHRATERYIEHSTITTYSRTGVFWRGGLLHSVSGVSYWTLQEGIVGHLRPYANNGRFLLVLLERSDTGQLETKCRLLEHKTAPEV